MNKHITSILEIHQNNKDIPIAIFSSSSFLTLKQQINFTIYLIVANDLSKADLSSLGF